MCLCIVNDVEWEIDADFLLLWVKHYFSTGVVRIPADLLILVSAVYLYDVQIFYNINVSC
jgi:hypothetical protein